MTDEQSNPPAPPAPDVAEQIAAAVKEAVAKVEAEKDAVIAGLKADLAKVEAAYEQAVATIDDEPAVLAADVEAVLEKFGHDIIGQAHSIFDGVKALVAKAKASV